MTERIRLFSLTLQQFAAEAAEAAAAEPAEGEPDSHATDPAEKAAAKPPAPSAEEGGGQTPAESPEAEAEDAPLTDTGRLLRSMRLQLEARRNRARAAEVLEGWRREAEELKDTYPDFSLQSALREGGDFARLLKAGVSLRRAYETAHLEEILCTAMRYAARRAGQRSAALLRDQQARPQENPVQQRAATQQGTDVNSLTGNDILRILGEVSRGAKITFK